MHIKYIHACYLTLKALLSGEKSRSKIILAARVGDKEATNRAIKELVAKQMISERTEVNIKPGPNPKFYRITDAGREEFARLQKEYR